jgi:hypothetical protein
LTAGINKKVLVRKFFAQKFFAQRSLTQRFSALAAASLVCLGLAACSSLSTTVTDNWPTWAGGMPKDVPPRPGAPGYDEFIAHQQSRAASAPTASTETAPPAPGAPVTAMPTGTVTPPGAPQATAPQAMAPPPAAANAYAPAPPARNGQPDDRAVAQGGLY